MALKLMYLEERIALVRQLLDRKSLQFQDALPEPMRMAFRDYIWKMMTILEGDPFGQHRVKDEHSL